MPASSPSSGPSFARRLLMGSVLAILLGYPLMFFAHKYSIPWSGMNDFSSYHRMVEQPPALDEVRAPFAMRQITTLAAHGLLRLGVSFDKDIWFDHHARWQGQSYSPRIFFALIVVNGLAAMAAAALLYADIAGRSPAPPELPFHPTGLCAVALLYLSGGSLFYVFAPLTEGMTWLLLTLIWLCLRREGRLPYLGAALIPLCIFQREMLPLALLILVLAEWAGEPAGSARRRAMAVAAGVCVLSLVAYYLLRTSILPLMPSDRGQMAPLTWAGRLLRRLPELMTPEMIRGILFKLNIYAIWAAVMVRHGLKGRLDRRDVLHVLGLSTAVSALMLISYANGGDRGTDRLAMILVPAAVWSILALGGRRA